MDDNLELDVRDLNSTSSTVQIRVKPSNFLREPGKPYKSLPERFRPGLELVGDYVRTTMIPRVFRDEGPGWAPLSPRTQKDRAKKGYGAAHPILKRTGDLYQELVDKSHPHHVEVIRTGRVSRIEIGGSSAKFIENQTGKGDPGQRLPARHMIPGTGSIPISDVDRSRIKEILTKAIQKEFNK